MAKDIFHETVKKALEKDGWTITHDPYYLNDKIKNIKYEVDLGAEKLLAAERDSEKIAVEIKSFTKISFRHEFHAVLGQYLIYYKGLYQIEPERQLFLAMEKIKKYQKAIINVMNTYQRTSNTVETLLLVDTAHHHYQVVEAGWQDADHYHYGILFHIHIKPTGKVVILENNTEDDLAEFLIDKGVLKSDIVINFIPERVRQSTGYAVA